MKETINTIISSITLITSIILIILIYRMNRYQTEILKRFNVSQPAIKILPSKISYHSLYEDYIVINIKYNAYSYNELRQVGDLLELIRTNLRFPIDIILNLMIYIEGKNGVGIIITNFYLEIYDGDILIGSRLSVNGIREADTGSEEAMLDFGKEFNPIHIKSQTAIHKLIKFQTINEDLNEDKEYRFNVIVETTEGEFRDEFYAQFNSLKTKLMEEKNKISRAIEFAEGHNIMHKGNYQVRPIFKIDLLLRGLGEFTDSDLLRDTFKFTNSCEHRVNKSKTSS